MEDFPDLPLKLLTPRGRRWGSASCPCRHQPGNPFCRHTPHAAAGVRAWTSLPGQRCQRVRTLLSAATQVITLPPAPADGHSPGPDGEAERARQYAQLLPIGWVYLGCALSHDMEVLSGRLRTTLIITFDFTRTKNIPEAYPMLGRIRPGAGNKKKHSRVCWRGIDSNSRTPS